MGGSVESEYYVDGAVPDSPRWRILSPVVHMLSYQTKVQGAHSIYLGVRGPQFRKYLPYGVRVLLYTPLLNSMSLVIKNPSKYPF